MKISRRAAILGNLGLLASGSLGAIARATVPSQKAALSAGPVAAVRQYIDAFNNGDAKAMAAMCADPMSILDGMAPHIWHGPTATQDWYKDVLAEGEHLGARDYHVTLGKPAHADVTGDAAYVVVPTTMKFKLRDKQVTQSGAIFTVALRKLPAGWRLASWAWSKGTASVS